MNNYDLVLELENSVSDKTIIGLAILSAIRSCDKYSDDEILSFVKDQARDNHETMKGVIPTELLDRILNYKP
ncbi:MAG TPA: hypothetical protein VIJ57_08865 [Hanamia sp.]